MSSRITLPKIRYARVAKGALLVGALGWACIVVGCAEDGANSTCTEVPLYDVRSDAAPDKATQDAIDKAISEGCLSPPGSAKTISTGGSGGSGGSGGAAGSGGSGGS